MSNGFGECSGSAACGSVSGRWHDEGSAQALGEIVSLQAQQANRKLSEVERELRALSEQMKNAHVALDTLQGRLGGGGVLPNAGPQANKAEGAGQMVADQGCRSPLGQAVRSHRRDAESLTARLNRLIEDLCI